MHLVVVWIRMKEEQVVNQKKRTIRRANQHRGQILQLILIKGELVTVPCVLVVEGSVRGRRQDDCFWNVPDEFS
jgi:hypothetical protein